MPDSLRILTVINRFPPNGGGGYSMRIQDHLTVLRERGHTAVVLTSSAGCDQPGETEPGVHRLLHIVGEVHGMGGIVGLAQTSAADVATLRRLAAKFKPDVILVGNFFGLTAALWNGFRSLGIPLVLDMSNEWLLDLAGTHGNWFRIFEKPSRGVASTVVKGLLSSLCSLYPGGALRTRFPGLLAHGIATTSHHMMEKLTARTDEPLPPATWCGSGIRMGLFPLRDRDPEAPVRRLLYVGRIKAMKGIHTALSALTHLPPEMTMAIVGVPDDLEYEAGLKRQAAESPLAGRVSFHAPVPREELEACFAEYDLLVFPSECNEAFSRLILEAFACGIPVVATPRGGTKEIVKDGVNGVLFQDGDPAALAEGVRRMADDDELRARCIAAGRIEVEQNWAIETAATRLEGLLREAAATTT